METCDAGSPGIVDTDIRPLELTPAEIDDLTAAGSLGWYDAVWYEVSMLVAYWDGQ